MARVNNLNDFLTDVADAIRTKKETTEQIPAENFDQEILSIETGIDTSDATANANDLALNKTAYVNGEKIEGNIYVASSNSIISGGKFLENSPYLGVCTDRDLLLRAGGAIEITEEQVSTKGNITPEKIVKGNTIFGVEGTAETGGSGGSGDIKLFETEEEMQADPTAKEGDLAVVYRSEIQNATVDSKFQTATFPETVVLDTAITDYVEVRYRAVDSSVMFDCWGGLDSSRFMMDCYSESGEVRIEYTSSDGITYTRTDSTGNPVDFGTEIYYIMPEMWNNAIGKFIQAGGNIFEGLFEYTLNYTEPNIYQNANYLKSDSNYYEINDKILQLSTNKGGGRAFIIPNKVIKTNNYYKVISGTIYSSNYIEYNIVKQPSRTLLCFSDLGLDSYSDTTTVITKTDFDLSLENVAISKTDVTKSELLNYPYAFDLTNRMGNWYSDMILTNEIIVNIDLDIPVLTITTDEAKPTGSIDNTVEICYVKRLIHNLYMNASTQFNLTSSGQLLPGKIAYGKNGVVEGDKTIYDNLDYDTLYEQLGLTIYDDIELINSTFEKGKVYSLTHTNEEDENTMYYRPVKRIINSSKVLNDEICSATGTTDTYRTSSNSLRCSNYNCNLYIGTTNKNVYFVVYDDDNNIINCNSIFTTNQSTYGIYSRVVVDENYYYYDTQYGTDNVIIKVNREDGTCIIKHFTVPVSLNSFQLEYTCTFTELNNNLVYVDANSGGKGNVLYVDKNLNVIKNISYTYPDEWASEYPSTAVVMNNCLYWTIRCNLNRLFRFDGNSVIYGSEIGTGTGIAGINNMFTDGQYIYTGWYGAAGIYKLDKDCRVVATLDSSYDIPLYNNLYNYDFEITDYRNYSCKDAYGHKRIVKDGVLQRNYVHVTGLTFITNGNLLNDLRLGNTLVGKNVMAKIQKGTHTNAYNNIVTKNTNNHIYVTSLYEEPLYEETISPVEYNTAISTANEILGEEV